MLVSSILGVAVGVFGGFVVFRFVCFGWLGGFWWFVKLVWVWYCSGFGVLLSVLWASGLGLVGVL